MIKPYGFQFTMPMLNSYRFYTSGSVVSKRKSFYGIKVTNGKYRLRDDNNKQITITVEEIITYGRHKEQELKLAFGLYDNEVIIIRQITRDMKRIKFKCLN